MEYCAAQEDRLGEEVGNVEGQVLVGSPGLQVDQNSRAEEVRKVKILGLDQTVLGEDHSPDQTDPVDSTRRKQDVEGIQAERSDCRVVDHQVLDLVETRSKKPR